MLPPGRVFAPLHAGLVQRAVPNSYSIALFLLIGSRTHLRGDTSIQLSIGRFMWLQRGAVEKITRSDNRCEVEESGTYPMSNLWKVFPFRTVNFFVFLDIPSEFNFAGHLLRPTTAVQVHSKPHASSGPEHGVGSATNATLQLWTSC